MFRMSDIYFATIIETLCNANIYGSGIGTMQHTKGKSVHKKVIKQGLDYLGMLTVEQ